MVREAGERTWAAAERAGAEAASRASEERFQQFAKASAAGLWVREAETFTIEYVNPAICTIYGTEPDALLGEIRQWASLIVPEDRQGALSHL
ncbi:PAS domain S-box protein [Rhizobium cauense]|uniref:PAS domain-containing protein n=1 Tax=Rhizobium cauense TaxID=1166683 RepID=UPI001C6E55FF|nr:PAS domain S-box protein [Rhizobium cauense]